MNHESNCYHGCNHDDEPLIEESDSRKLILSFATARQGKGFTEDEAHELISWANGVIIQAASLDMILDGTLLVEWGDGEPCLTDAKQKLTVAQYEEFLGRLEELDDGEED